ncbi:MAG: GNAT family N-acetyltransferase [Clostridia bacterium]|nr:GNAT family N-acetyltransferase [Clostridia bacterium]
MRIKTERLIIDPIRPEDKPDYFRQISHDRKVLETFICRYAESLDDFDFSRYLNRDDLYAIRRKEDGRLIGIILYFDVNGTEKTCEIGYGIGSGHWNRGYATEAVRGFLDWLFTENGFRTVFASFFTGNEASKRVMEKCGMRYSRFSEKELTYLDVERDLTYYEISRKNHVVYVHGKGGSPEECERFRPLFPGSEVTGLDYRSLTPKEAASDIRAAFSRMDPAPRSVTLIANSVGAFFCMCADVSPLIRKAYFISPVVDMERMILDLTNAAGATEQELRDKGVIHSPFGVDLFWEDLDDVRRFPIRWDAPIEILRGEKDELVPFETVAAFAEKHSARVTVLKDGPHWFHTDEQLRFLDDWIRACEKTPDD